MNEIGQAMAGVRINVGFLDIVAVPEGILKLHNDLAMGMDIVFVNELPFSMTTTSQIKFTMMEFIASLKTSNLFECCKSVVALHDS